MRTSAPRDQIVLDFRPRSFRFVSQFGLRISSLKRQYGNPMKSDEPLYLNEGQVKKHLPMAELIAAMEKALIEFSAGKVTQPVRSVINVDPPGGFLGLMPSLTPDGLGLKAVTFFPSNAEHGIPTHMATIFLVDPQTGTPLAIMDG